MRPWRSLIGALGLLALPATLVAPAIAGSTQHTAGSNTACPACAARPAQKTAKAAKAKTAVKARPASRTRPASRIRPAAKAKPASKPVRAAQVGPAYTPSQFPNVVVRSVPAASAPNAPQNDIIVRPAGATEPLKVPTALSASPNAMVAPVEKVLPDGSVIELTRPEEISYMIVRPGKDGPVLECPPVAPAPAEKTGKATDKTNDKAKEGGR